MTTHQIIEKFFVFVFFNYVRFHPTEILIIGPDGAQAAISKVPR